MNEVNEVNEDVEKREKEKRAALHIKGGEYRGSC